MSEDLLINNCSPTLAGIKTASLFSYTFESRNELYDDIRQLNKRFRNRGILVIPIRIWDNKALIYVYRPKLLERDFKNADLISLLKEHDYSTDSVNRCIACLIDRMKSFDEFPHEVGAFLGYPAEDIRGFIDNKGSNCKCVGYWKVYGDIKSSTAAFERFTKCTRIYREAYSRGRSIDSLLV